jgi:hypothetical protein
MTKKRRHHDKKDSEFEWRGTKWTETRIRKSLTNEQRDKTYQDMEG